jgi:hypothetical protein
VTTTHPGSAPASLREWATGVTVFAAIMLMIGGILDVIRGIVELGPVRDEKGRRVRLVRERLEHVEGGSQ